jgi:hypothetical protein
MTAEKARTLDEAAERVRKMLDVYGLTRVVNPRTIDDYGELIVVSYRLMVELGVGHVTALGVVTSYLQCLSELARDVHHVLPVAVRALAEVAALVRDQPGVIVPTKGDILHLIAEQPLES